MLFKVFFSKSDKSYEMLEEKSDKMIFNTASTQIAQFYAKTQEDAEARCSETVERHKRQNKHLFY